MASKATVEANFQTGDTPTQAQFEEFFDSIPWLSEENTFTESQTVLKSFDGSLEFNASNYDEGASAGAYIAANSVGGLATIKSTQQSSAVEISHGDQFGGFYAMADDNGAKMLIEASATNPLEIASPSGVKISTVPTSYADNAAAVAAGLMEGMIYRTGDVLKIVHA